MTQPLTNQPKRRGRIFPEYTISPEELARRQAEIDDFGQRCKVIWQKVCPELIKEHYNWFIIIEPDSGDYFIDPDEDIAEEKARQTHPHGMLCTFRINETGACGLI